MITRLNGQLEIDHDRGVVYFHITDPEDIRDRAVVTALRICGLPCRVPPIESRMLDISLTKEVHPPRMVAVCDWGR